MKYRLLFFLLAIMLQAPVMFADDDVVTAQITFVVDDASRVSISNAGEAYTIENGSNTFDVMQWSNITIAPKEGCILVSVKNSQNEELTLTNGEVTFMIYETTPETYTITSETASTVNFTIDVDNPAKVSVMNKNYQAITLNAGQNCLNMSALNFPLLIGASTYGQELYQVLYNGKAVEPYYGSYSLTPEDNGIIKITADFPDIDCKVEFSYPEGVTNFFTEVTVNDKPDPNFKSGLNVKCGDKVKLYYNASLWDNEDSPVIVKINGVEPQWMFPGYSFVVKENTEVSVTQAVPVEMITVSLEADNPNNIAVYRNNKDYYRDRVYLNNGINEISLPKEAATLIITNVEADGEESRITGITINGTPKNVTYYNEVSLYDLEANDAIKVFTEGNFGGSSSVDTIKTVSESEGVYNLMGVKVAENAENLPAGIYIVDGKKIAVK